MICSKKGLNKFHCNSFSQGEITTGNAGFSALGRDFAGSEQPAKKPPRMAAVPAGTREFRRDWRKFTVSFLLMACLFAVGYNIWRLFDGVNTNFADGFCNRLQGRFFTAGEGFSYQLIRLAKDKIPKGSRCCYWTIPSLQKEISTECRVLELNYYLYPITVYYLDDSEILLSDHLICDIALLSHLKRRLLELELITGVAQDFTICGQNEHTVVLKREE